MDEEGLAIRDCFTVGIEEGPASDLETSLGTSVWTGVGAGGSVVMLVAAGGLQACLLSLTLTLVMR